MLNRKSLEEERQDVFNRKQEEEDESVLTNIDKTESLPDRFDELPVELASLTDRYVKGRPQRLVADDTTDSLSL